jgi:hypothetical protein
MAIPLIFAWSDLTPRSLKLADGLEQSLTRIKGDTAPFGRKHRSGVDAAQPKPAALPWRGVEAFRDEA